MCLSPITVKNPSRHASSIIRRMYITVPCGHCEECKQVKTLEWTHRTYNTHVDFQSRQGYTLFQTLTYDEYHVPRLFSFHGHRLNSPFRVFSRDDIKTFRSCLRDAIRSYRVGGGFYPWRELYNNDNFKVIITSEYGGVTHRPHYHALFFCSIPGLTPGILDSLIKRCWTKGFVDRSFFRNRIVSSEGALAYVNKYIAKDDDFVNTIHDELSQFGDIDYSDDVIRNIMPFHVQSQGFGKCAIEIQGLDNIVSTGTISMPDKLTIYSTIPVPMYLQRQVFYTLVEDKENINPHTNKPRKRWIINDLGIKFKMNMLKRQLSKRVITLQNQIERIKSTALTHNIPKFKSIIDDVLSILNGASLLDYSKYQLISKGVCSSIKFRDYMFMYRSLLIASRDSPFVGEAARSLQPLAYSPDCAILHPVDKSFSISSDFPYLDRLLDEGTQLINSLKAKELRERSRIKSRLKLITEGHLCLDYLNNLNFCAYETPLQSNAG